MGARETAIGRTRGVWENNHGNQMDLYDYGARHRRRGSSKLQEKLLCDMRCLPSVNIAAVRKREGHTQTTA